MPFAASAAMSFSMDASSHSSARHILMPDFEPQKFTPTSIFPSTGNVSPAAAGAAKAAVNVANLDIVNVWLGAGGT